MGIIGRKNCSSFLCKTLILLFALTKLSLAEVKFAGYGENCDFHSCDTTKYLICLNNKCNCSSPDTMTYEKNLGTCAVNTGYSCHQEESYTQNISPPESPYISGSRTSKFTRNLPCKQGNVCIKSTCEIIIQPKVEYNVENKLSLISCDYRGNKKCPSASGLNCVDGYCKCSLGAQQYYDGTKCVGLVNAFCDPAINGTDDVRISEDILRGCTDNAWCVSKGFWSTCQCQTGFVSNLRGRCVPDYQQPCDEKNHICSSEGLMACVNGKCECESELYVYDAESKRCTGLVGSSCQRKEFGINSELRDPCVLFAHCVPHYQLGKFTSGICKCLEGYLETINRTCIYKESKRRSYG